MPIKKFKENKIYAIQIKWKISPLQVTNFHRIGSNYLKTFWYEIQLTSLVDAEAWNKRDCKIWGRS